MDLKERRHIKRIMLKDGVPKETIEKVITNHYNKPLANMDTLEEIKSHRIILCAFSWDESPEGWDFWNAEEEYWCERCE